MRAAHLKSNPFWSSLSKLFGYLQPKFYLLRRFEDLYIAVVSTISTIKKSISHKNINSVFFVSKSQPSGFPFNFLSLFIFCFSFLDEKCVLFSDVIPRCLSS